MVSTGPALAARMVSKTRAVLNSRVGAVTMAADGAPSVVSLDTLSSALEQRIECAPKPEASAPFAARTKPSVAGERPAAQFTAPVTEAAAVDSIDLAKIGSILNSLSSVMKSTGE